MADKDLTIALKTTADNTGTDTTVDGLKKVEGEVKILDTATSKSLAERKQAEQEFSNWQKSLQTERAGAGTSGTAMPTLAATEARDRLARSTRILAEEEQNLSRVSSVSGSQVDLHTGGIKNMGMAVSGASYQLQDFAVQVGGGTSAITAFAQQAPQLIGQLSMAGVFTGGLSMAMMGVAAAIPIVLLGGKALIAGLGQMGESAKEVEERYKTLSQAFEKHSLQKLKDQAADKKTADAIRVATAADYTASNTAENTYARTVLDNAEKIRKAEIDIAEALGLQWDKMALIEESAKREEARRNLKATQDKADIVAEWTKINQARDQAAMSVNNEIDKLDRAQKLLETKKGELERLKNETAVAQAVIDKPRDQNNGSWAPQSYSQARADARETLADPKTQQRITDTEKSIEKLKDDIKALGDGSTRGSIADLNVALIEADKKLDDSTTSSREKVTAIQATLDADTTAADVKKVVDIQTQAAADIDAQIAKLTPLTEDGKKVIADLRTLTADNKLAANEVVKAQQDMRLLNDLLVKGLVTSRDNQSSTLTNTNALISEVGNITGIVARQKDEIAALKRRVGNLGR